jgi:hypothetical protein
MVSEKLSKEKRCQGAFLSVVLFVGYWLPPGLGRVRSTCRLSGISGTQAFRPPTLIYSDTRFDDLLSLRSVKGLCCIGRAPSRWAGLAGGSSTSSQSQNRLSYTVSWIISMALESLRFLFLSGSPCLLDSLPFRSFTSNYPWPESHRDESALSTPCVERTSTAPGIAQKSARRTSSASRQRRTIGPWIHHCRSGHLRNTFKLWWGVVIDKPIDPGSI